MSRSPESPRTANPPPRTLASSVRPLLQRLGGYVESARLVPSLNEAVDEVRGARPNVED
jgi:hypothetical protein